MKILQGIDITSVRRIRSAMERNGKGFRDRVFTVQERRYCESRHMKYEHYAARFAAKEAVVKALGLGGTHATRLRDIEIRRRANGKPYVHLSPPARKAFGLPRKFRLDISLTHERDYAMAAAILILP